MAKYPPLSLPGYVVSTSQICVGFFRFAISHHRIFLEPRKSMFTHSAASRSIAEDSLTRDGLGLQFDDAWDS